MTKSPGPDDGAGEVAEGVEVADLLVKAGEDAAEVFELADEAFDQVALLVGGVIAGTQFLLIADDGRVSIIPRSARILSGCPQPGSGWTAGYRSLCRSPT